jgi:hypothetical protein
MEITTRKTAGQYDGREVPYVELEVLGGKHTLSVRKYPKNVSVQMWENSDKRGTKVTLKFPHNKFLFSAHVMGLIANFDTEITRDVMETLQNKWNNLVTQDNF